MSDALYLDHVASRLARIARYTAGGREVFLTDEKTQDAVLRNLHTLAESTQRLSDEIRARHAEIDWRAISGFRNVIVHNYLGLDAGQVWAIVDTDLPVLGAAIEQMRAEAGRDQT